MCLLPHGHQPRTPSANGLKICSRPTRMGSRFVSITRIVGNVWNHVPTVVCTSVRSASVHIRTLSAQIIERIKASGRARAVLANDKFWAHARPRPQWKLVVMRAMTWMEQVRTVSVQEVFSPGRRRTRLGKRCPLEPPRRGRSAGTGQRLGSQHAWPHASCGTWCGAGTYAQRNQVS